jgi:hypothetical protein
MTIHRHHEPMIGFVLLSLSSVTVACNFVCVIILSCAPKQTASNPKFLDQRKLQFFVLCTQPAPSTPSVVHKHFLHHSNLQFGFVHTTIPIIKPSLYKCTKNSFIKANNYKSKLLNVHLERESCSHEDHGGSQACD